LRGDAEFVASRSETLYRKTHKRVVWIVDQDQTNEDIRIEKVAQCLFNVLVKVFCSQRLRSDLARTLCEFGDS
jgi:hypothetical protein